MDLYIVRHAAAYERDPARWPDDSGRPLTPEGEAGFTEAARGLAELVPRVDALLSSPYARAWRTAEILAAECSWPTPEPLAVLEPTLPPEKIVPALADYEGERAVAVVGHRPGLHELASYLLSGEAGAVRLSIKKGGVLRISFDDALRPGAGALHWLLTPQVLHSLAVR